MKTLLLLLFISFNLFAQENDDVYFNSKDRQKTELKKDSITNTFYSSRYLNPDYSYQRQQLYQNRYAYNYSYNTYNISYGFRNGFRFGYYNYYTSGFLNPYSYMSYSYYPMYNYVPIYYIPIQDNHKRVSRSNSYNYVRPNRSNFNTRSNLNNFINSGSHRSNFGNMNFNNGNRNFSTATHHRGR